MGLAASTAMGCLLSAGDLLQAVDSSYFVSRPTRGDGTNDCMFLVDADPLNLSRFFLFLFGSFALEGRRRGGRSFRSKAFCTKAWLRGFILSCCSFFFFLFTLSIAVSS